MLGVNSTKKEEIFYEKLFNDNKHSQFIQGGEVFNLFIKSGLNKNILKQIWELASKRKKPNLSKEEFSAACRYISLAQNGYGINEDNFYYKENLPLAKFEGIEPPKFDDDNRHVNKNMSDLLTFFENDYQKNIGAFSTTNKTKETFSFENTTNLSQNKEEDLNKKDAVVSSNDDDFEFVEIKEEETS